jgi:cell wall-associated NlpC family hydrolase
MAVPYLTPDQFRASLTPGRPEFSSILGSVPNLNITQPSPVSTTLFTPRQTAQPQASATGAATQAFRGAGGFGGGTSIPAPTVGSAGSGGNTVINYASKFLGVPYSWGGTDPGGRGVDCSGFTYTVAKGFGAKIPRTAQQQLDGLPAGKLEPGAILIWSSGGPSGRHAGIYAGGDKIIHSSGGGVQWGSFSERKNRLLGVRTFAPLTDQFQVGKLNQKIKSPDMPQIRSVQLFRPRQQITSRPNQAATQHFHRGMAAASYISKAPPRAPSFSFPAALNRFLRSSSLF